MSAAATYIADQGWPVMSGVQRSPFLAVGPRTHRGASSPTLPHRFLAGLACCSSAAAAFAKHLRSSSATCRADLGYSEPVPIEPKDELADLLRQNLELQRAQQKQAERIEHLLRVTSIKVAA